MSLQIGHRWACEFRGGKPILDTPQTFMEECRRLDGQRGYVAIQTPKRMKSNEQNRYYRGVVVARFAEYWGCSNEDAHRALCFEHLQLDSENPEMPKRIKSTQLSDWTTGEWENYMEFLRRWALEQFGVYIEEPNEVDYTSLPQVDF